MGDGGGGSEKRHNDLSSSKNRYVTLPLRSFHPYRTCTQILVKVCTLVIQYMYTQEMK